MDERLEHECIKLRNKQSDPKVNQEAFAIQNLNNDSVFYQIIVLLTIYLFDTCDYV